jgi:hypothetical protein
MLLGNEAIGVLAIGIDRPGVNLFTAVEPTPLIFDALTSLNQRLHVNDVTEILIGDSATQSMALNDFNVGSLIYQWEEQSNKSSRDDSLLYLDLNAEDAFSRGYGIDDPVSLIINSTLNLGFVLSEFSVAEFIINANTYNKHYTFNLQEFEDVPTPITVGGFSNDLFYPIDGTGTGITEIPQIWIG